MGMTSPGVLYVVPNHPFRLLGANFSRGTLTFPKGDGDWSRRRSPCVLSLGGTIARTKQRHAHRPRGPLQPVVKREVQMETARDISREHDDRLKENWQESVRHPYEYSTYLQSMLEMLGTFADMWDFHLGRIKASKQRIERSSPEVRPIHSSPY